MMTSLADAWNWYTNVRSTTLAIQALEKHWNDLPWEGALGHDNRLRLIEAVALKEWGYSILNDLDDLAVLLLFSVFEATVRERALRDVEAELPNFRHPALRYAIDTLNEGLEHGSFWKVLEAYKGLDPDLIEQVNQVRKYRNWVAHGRRGEVENTVQPRAAYARLQRFLDRMKPAEVPPP